MYFQKCSLINPAFILSCFLSLSLASASAGVNSFAVSSHPYSTQVKENMVHSRVTRSLRMERAWTRSGYGVVFVYSNAFNEYEVQKLKTAAYEIRKHSCFPVTILSQASFWNREFRKYPHYVFIEKSQAIGCGQAYVGMKGGYQLLTMNPDPRCLVVGTIMHEMLHTLGIEHEQSRPDRNQFIQINNPNVQTGLHNVFNIAYGSKPYGPYDFDSVMHYGRYSFSAYPNLPTLTSRVPGYYVPASGNYQLSFWDKKKINAITGCNVNS